MARNSRTEFTAKQKVEIWHAANGRCQGKRCGRKIRPGEPRRYDHITPIALGGKTTVVNGQLLGLCCDPEKTAGDIKRIRKADRQSKSFLGLKPKSRLSRPHVRRPVAPRDEEAHVRRMQKSHIEFLRKMKGGEDHDHDS